MKAVAAHPEDDQRFQMQHPTSFPGVCNVVTEVPLKRVKKTTALPVGQWAQTRRLSYRYHSRAGRDQRMGRLVEGLDRTRTTLFPECLDDWIDEDNPVRVIDALVDSIDLGEFGFGDVVPEATGRPGYHPSVLLELSIYG